MRRNDRQRVNGQENKRTEKKTKEKIGKRVEHIILRFLFHSLSSGKENSPHRIRDFPAVMGLFAAKVLNPGRVWVCG